MGNKLLLDPLSIKFHYLLLLGCVAVLSSVMLLPLLTQTYHLASNVLISCSVTVRQDLCDRSFYAAREGGIVKKTAVKALLNGFSFGGNEMLRVQLISILLPESDVKART